jgi:hypothetical protein
MKSSEGLDLLSRTQALMLEVWTLLLARVERVLVLLSTLPPQLLG